MAVNKGGKKGKFAKKSGPQKPEALKPLPTPTLKERYASTNKVITASQMNWKPVEIPDNLGDYSGFLGLEELDGVDVRMVNGNAEFIAKESKISAADLVDKMLGNKKKPRKQKKAPKEAAEPSAATATAKASKKEQKGQAKKAPKEQVSEQSEEKVVESEDESVDSEEEFCGFDDAGSESETEAAAFEAADSELLQNSFAALDMPLPDDNDIDLPAWDALALSGYTMSGLQSNGFTEPTPIQTQAIPLALAGRDVIGKATTGSGKTLAYGIPILERYIARLDEVREDKCAHKVPAPAGLVFAPTRELAHQVVDHMNKIARLTPLAQNGIVSITGGLSIQKQERLLSYGPGVIVATPGRFLELIEKNEELNARMAAADIVVLDEADRLLQDGHFDEFARILDLLGKKRAQGAHSAPGARGAWRWQTLVFSATFSRDLFGKLAAGKTLRKKDAGLAGNDEVLELLKKKLTFRDPRPALCDANPAEVVSGHVSEALVECGATERDLYIYYFLLTYPGSTLVFANSVESVRRLVPFLANLNIPAFAIHSSMMQKQRLRALERFKSSCAKNATSVLVATDVAARGLDIPSIDHVAHYHLPRSADVYVHRSGRTARAGKEGVSVMFCSPQEAAGPLRKLRKIVAAGAERRVNAHDVKLLPIDHDIVAQIRERVQLASKLGDSSIAGTATRKEDSWLKQAAEDLGVDDIHELGDFEDDVIKKQRRRKERRTLTKNDAAELRHKLRDLLSRPLRKNHRRSYLTSGLENLAHQIVTGNTSKDILGKQSVRALDELRGSRNRVEKKKSK